MRNKKLAIFLLVIFILVLVCGGLFLSLRRVDLSCPGIDFLNVSLGPSAQPSKLLNYIKVISPRFGDIYHVGDTISIQWVNCNYRKDIPIYIYDSRSYKKESYSSRQAIIAKGVKMVDGINTYEYQIPPSIGTYFSGGKLGGYFSYSLSIDTGVSGGFSGAGSSVFSILP